ncbi:protein kinase domain-containing protein [Artemisia annua]|uniref:Protein kinase domain-containing protein n=1 Tax=Artemisia annua TaxID=35608 RepID=A0A2U1MB59_ARTAN|nr:protein kinase domain-containing protein [Artemisia annua]
MIIFVFLFMSFILSCHSALNDSISIPICPESFSCPNFATFKYPFYNVTDARCGLIKVQCNSEGGEIQIGEKRYEIVGKFDSSSSVTIRNITLEKLVNHTSCEALMNNFTSPNPLLYSISIAPFLTLFKCTKNTSYAYFNQPNYNSHNTCKNYNFYYDDHSVSNATVPSDLPRTCEVVQLPMIGGSVFSYHTTTIFSLLSSRFPSISISLTRSCEKCHNKGGRCHANKGQFQCFCDKTETGRHLMPVILLLGNLSSPSIFVALTILIFINNDIYRTLSALGAGTVMILFIIILCLKKKYRWGEKAEYNVNVEIFLKNQEFLAPKRYSYSQIKKMTNSFEVKLGQGGFGSVYRGELSGGNLVAVKILSELKGNGKDFVNEVASVGRTCHVNIV